MDPSLVTPDEIASAHERIRPHVLRSPIVELAGSGARVKAESLQPSGSFKLRGAFNSLLTLDDEARRRGVVAHSSGNHAIAVAMAGAELGIAVTVVMPRDAPAVKQRWTRALGAAVELVGPDSSERSERAAELAAADGLFLVEPYNSRQVIAATATIAIEILEDLDAGGEPLELYVPISGGGLSGGVAAGAKRRDARTRIVGVEPELAADALASRRAGRPVALPAEQMERTMADGLRVRQVGTLAWPHLEAFVDDIVTVSEREIRAAMRSLATQARLVSEPSGAVSVAAAMAGRGGGGSSPDRRVAVLTGGNVDPELYASVLAEETAPDP